MQTSSIKVAADHLRGSYYNHLSFAVDNNPTQVYRFLASSYPNQIGIWEPGFEKSEEAKIKMLSLLNEKAIESRNANQYTIDVLQLIPYNPEADNWTKIQ